MAHFITRCPCGTVVEQCKCPGVKVEKVELCSHCKKKAYDNALQQAVIDGRGPKRLQRPLTKTEYRAIAFELYVSIGRGGPQTISIIEPDGSWTEVSMREIAELCEALGAM